MLWLPWCSVVSTCWPRSSTVWPVGPSAPLCWDSSSRHGRPQHTWGPPAQQYLQTWRNVLYYVCISIIWDFVYICSFVYLTEVKWNTGQTMPIEIPLENNQRKEFKVFQMKCWIILRESEQRYISHFWTEQSESTRRPNLFRKQEDYKTALLFLVPKLHRNFFFFFSTSNNTADVLAQWIFRLKPLFPLVRVQWFRWNTTFTEPWVAQTQTETSIAVRLHFITHSQVKNKKKIMFFVLSLPIMHTVGNGHAGMLVDTKFKHIPTQNMHKISKAPKDIWYRKDQRQRR